MVTHQGSARGRRRDPVLITNLATSRTAEIRERERRYVITMLIRAVCFIVAVVAFSGPARWIAMAAAVFLPWVAVIFANAPKARPSRHAAYVPPAPRETPGLEAAKEHEVIDPDV